MPDLRRPHRIVILAIPPVVPFDLGIPAQLFGGVPPTAGSPAYIIEIVTPDGSSSQTTSGYSVTAEGGLDRLAHADTIVVPGSHAAGLRERGIVDPAVAAALGDAAGRSRVVALCTGSFVLAAAGLLDGVAAAVHWRYAKQFGRLFAEVRVDAESLFVESDRGLYTSAGGAAALDLCIHLIRHDHGDEVADDVARMHAISSLRGGAQPQLATRPVVSSQRGSTAGARQKMLSTLEETYSLAELAKEANMSVRTFTRQFREETGMSPIQWLREARFERARELLETTDLSIETVATESGFGSGTNLRASVSHRLGSSPLKYRQTYRSSSAG